MHYYSRIALFTCPALGVAREQSKATKVLSNLCGGVCFPTIEILVKQTNKIVSLPNFRLDIGEHVDRIRLRLFAFFGDAFRVVNLQIGQPTSQEIRKRPISVIIVAERIFALTFKFEIKLTLSVRE